MTGSGSAVLTSRFARNEQGRYRLSVVVAVATILTLGVVPAAVGLVAAQAQGSSQAVSHHQSPSPRVAPRTAREARRGIVTPIGAVASCGNGTGRNPCDPACSPGPIGTCPEDKKERWGASCPNPFLPCCGDNDNCIMITYESTFSEEFVEIEAGLAGPTPYHDAALQGVTVNINKILAPVRKSPPPGMQLTTLLTDQGLFLAYEKAGVSVLPKRNLTPEKNAKQLDRVLGLPGPTSTNRPAHYHWVYYPQSGMIVCQRGDPYTQFVVSYVSATRLTTFHPKALQTATTQINAVLTKYRSAAQSTHKGLTLSQLSTPQGLFLAWTDQVNKATTTMTSKPGNPSIPLGTTNTDTATVTSNVPFSTSTLFGTVSFYLCGPDPAPTPCTSTSPGAQSLGGSNSNGNGADTFGFGATGIKPSSAGYWCFGSYYAGNDDHNATSDTSTDECFNVTGGSGPTGPQA